MAGGLWIRHTAVIQQAVPVKVDPYEPERASLQTTSQRKAAKSEETRDVSPGRGRGLVYEDINKTM